MPRELHIVLSGLPGKMETLVAETLLKEIENKGGFALQAQALTGPNQPREVSIGRVHGFYLIPPEKHEEVLRAMIGNETYKPLIVVDFSQPDAVNRNAELYCKLGIPFVMGTTGGDRKRLEQVVVDSGNVAVIAPNMALPIVALQEFMERFSRQHEGQMKGYTLKVRESHQQTKQDTSGTAKAFLKYFQRLGIELDSTPVDNLKMEKPVDIMLPLGGDSSFTVIRNPNTQRAMKIPEEHLAGHGWHKYTITPPKGSDLEELSLLQTDFSIFLGRHPAFRDYNKTDLPPRYDATSKDGNVQIAFGGLNFQGASDVFIQHNINGRQVYADGGFEAIRFLPRHLGERGKVYTMIDVMREIGGN